MKQGVRAARDTVMAATLSIWLWSVQQHTCTCLHVLSAQLPERLVLLCKQC